MPRANPTGQVSCLIRKAYGLDQHADASVIWR